MRPAVPKDWRELSGEYVPYSISYGVTTPALDVAMFMLIRAKGVNLRLLPKLIIDVRSRLLIG